MCDRSFVVTFSGVTSQSNGTVKEVTGTIQQKAASLVGAKQTAANGT